MIILLIKFLQLKINFLKIICPIVIPFVRTRFTLKVIYWFTFSGTFITFKFFFFDFYCFFKFAIISIVVIFKAERTPQIYVRMNVIPGPIVNAPFNMIIFFAETGKTQIASGFFFFWWFVPWEWRICWFGTPAFFLI